MFSRKAHCNKQIIVIGGPNGQFKCITAPFSIHTCAKPKQINNLSDATTKNE